MKSYYARLCYNTMGWREPTGEAAEVESPTTFVHQNGFGHEEWLFDPDAVVDGWHYGFIQPVNKSYKKVAGQTISLILYMIRPHAGHDRRIVGKIDACEVLTEDAAKVVVGMFEGSGRLKRMLSQVRKLDGNWKLLQKPDHALNIVNVRFKSWTKVERKQRKGETFHDYYQLYEAGGKTTPVIYPEEANPLKDAYWEGKRLKIYVSAQERDPAARAACIAHHGAKCAACGLEFHKRYGGIGIGFIHVHHRKPLGKSTRRRKVDPIKDLIPVCPNCHAMLHTSDPPLTVNRLRKMMNAT